MPEPAGPEPTAGPAADADPESGPRRALATLYGVFALAATARAVVQLTTQFDEAPLAYALSLFSGLVYLAATVGLATQRRWSRPLTLVAVGVELVGVLGIGLWSLLDPALFPHDTVWSKFGYGYVFIPVVLPLLGLTWWWRTRPDEPGRPPHRPQPTQPTAGTRPPERTEPADHRDVGA